MDFSCRRTFAIIAHPDAGKTTLTEQILLKAGAIHLAGQVKAKGQKRRVQSDFMKIEADRGISVSSAVMTFDYQGLVFNLLDTPGHSDFSEDTYRTLTAVDSVIMVLDAAKGIEEQTRKLFEICRLRDIPILTFINKIDHESLNPFVLLDDISEQLALDVCPRNWPIGTGALLKGIYHCDDQSFTPFKGPFQTTLPTWEETQHFELMQEIHLAEKGYSAFDEQAYAYGTQTPVYFGSALRCLGIEALLSFMARFSPSPRVQKARERLVEPNEKNVTGFVFKVQANMDAQHRDRVAFVRLCSGTFRKGMRLKVFPIGKTYQINNPVFFFAKERETIQEASAGDILGIPNHGTLSIGDTLTEGERLLFLGIPNFAPEILRTITPKDPLRSKHMMRALTELAQEGVVHVSRKVDTNAWVVGVVGALQLDVLIARMESEYGLEVLLEPLSFTLMRWIKAEKDTLSAFEKNYKNHISLDMEERPLFLAKNDWELNFIAEKNPHVSFTKTQERHT